MKHLSTILFIVASNVLTFAVVAAGSDTAPKAPQPKPAAPSATNGAATLDELFNTLDKDRDGKISKDEATGRYAQRFSQWDADGDGFATRQEIHDYRLSIGLDDNGQRVANANNRGPRRAAAAAILKEPADWRLEALPIPPTFAPDIALKGAEEIRFAPGMFDTKAGDYFTCVIAIVADGVAEMGAADIKDFLEKYYRGLSLGRARRAGLTPDPAEMRASVTPAPGADMTNRFVADVIFFDSFNDGRKITLNVEAQVIPRPDSKKTGLLFLVSPSPKESAVWQTLHAIGTKSALAIP